MVMEASSFAVLTVQLSPAVIVTNIVSLDSYRASFTKSIGNCTAVKLFGGNETLEALVLKSLEVKSPDVVTV